MIGSNIPEIRTENLPNFQTQKPANQEQANNSRTFIYIDKYIVKESQHFVAQIIDACANFLKEGTGFVATCAKYVFGDRNIQIPAPGQVLSSALSAFTGLNL